MTTLLHHPVSFNQNIYTLYDEEVSVTSRYALPTSRTLSHPTHQQYIEPSNLVSSPGPHAYTSLEPVEVVAASAALLSFSSPQQPQPQRQPLVPSSDSGYSAISSNKTPAKPKPKHRQQRRQQ
jgi:hypothetical protein